MAEHPNATLVRRLYDALRTKDRATLESMIAEEAMWHLPGSAP